MESKLTVPVTRQTLWMAKQNIAKKLKHSAIHFMGCIEIIRKTIFKLNHDLDILEKSLNNFRQKFQIQSENLGGIP